MILDTKDYQETTDSTKHKIATSVPLENASAATKDMTNYNKAGTRTTSSTTKTHETSTGDFYISSSTEDSMGLYTQGRADVTTPSNSFASSVVPKTSGTSVYTPFTKVATKNPSVTPQRKLQKETTLVSTATLHGSSANDILNYSSTDAPTMSITKMPVVTSTPPTTKVTTETKITSSEIETLSFPTTGTLTSGRKLEKETTLVGTATLHGSSANYILNYSSTDAPTMSITKMPVVTSTPPTTKVTTETKITSSEIETLSFPTTGTLTSGRKLQKETTLVGTATLHGSSANYILNYSSTDAPTMSITKMLVVTSTPPTTKVTTETKITSSEIETLPFPTTGTLTSGRKLQKETTLVGTATLHGSSANDILNYSSTDAPTMSITKMPVVTSTPPTTKVTTETKITSSEIETLSFPTTGTLTSGRKLQKETTLVGTATLHGSSANDILNYSSIDATTISSTKKPVVISTQPTRKVLMGTNTTGSEIETHPSPTRGTLVSGKKVPKESTLVSTSISHGTSTNDLLIINYSSTDDTTISSTKKPVVTSTPPTTKVTTGTKITSSEIETLSFPTTGTLTPGRKLQKETTLVSTSTLHGSSTNDILNYSSTDAPTMTITKMPVVTSAPPTTKVTTETKITSSEIETLSFPTTGTLTSGRKLHKETTLVGTATLHGSSANDILNYSSTDAPTMSITKIPVVTSIPPITKVTTETKITSSEIETLSFPTTGTLTSGRKLQKETTLVGTATLHGSSTNDILNYSSTDAPTMSITKIPVVRSTPPITKVTTETKITSSEIETLSFPTTGTLTPGRKLQKETTLVGTATLHGSSSNDILNYSSTDITTVSSTKKPVVTTAISTTVHIQCICSPHEECFDLGQGNKICLCAKGFKKTDETCEGETFFMKA